MLTLTPDDLQGWYKLLPATEINYFCFEPAIQEAIRMAGGAQYHEWGHSELSYPIKVPEGVQTC